MDDTLGSIRDKIGAENCSRSCSRDGCGVDLVDITQARVIANADSKGLARFFPGKRCDFILFFQNSDGTVVIVPLELKRGKADARSTAEQLQAGACFAESIIPDSCCPTCHPILFHGRKLNSVQRKELNRAKIDFREARLTIQTANCGKPGNLANALSDEQGQPQGRRKR